MSDVYPTTPRLATIPLPQVTPPLFIRASLSSTPSATLPVDFGAPSLTHALASLTPDEASRPATSPGTSVVRVVHPSLAYAPIYITPRQGSNVVTVMDVLNGLHSHFWTPITNINAYDTMRRRDIILAAQERCERLSVQNDDVRNVDLLEHATVFMGLIQDVAMARAMVAEGHAGIDQYQALTWILQTEEPRSGGQRGGLGPYNRQWR